MKAHFVFMDRVLPLEFFAEDPVKVTMLICDETDRKLNECMKRFAEADKAPVDRRVALYEKVLCGLIGEEKTEQILGRSEVRDCLAVSNVFSFLVNTYNDEKVKKLRGSAR